jgi:hypothetical protein
VISNLPEASVLVSPIKMDFLFHCQEIKIVSFLANKVVFTSYLTIASDELPKSFGLTCCQKNIFD